VEVIGVLDLWRGRAVHAVAGDREHYAPARMPVVPGVMPGDAAAIAGAYITTFGLSQIYVADLGAIVERAPQPALIRSIAALGPSVWLDAGIASVADARAAFDAGASRLVLGLETLISFATLASICNELGRERTAFSLDLRNGAPMTASPELAHHSVDALVTRAVDAGAGAVIVLDVARVGTNAGPDLDLIERVRTAAPAIMLIAGGGIRGRNDLARLQDAGCDAALVATALLNGRLTATDLLDLRPAPGTVDLNRST
jgi:phosphoribosylformimino-5-aminoimidazole carboxamide ribotide isomerase